MASHEELIAELVKLEKLSHAARLKHAKKRRLKQLKKYQEWVRYDRQTNATVSRKRIPAVLDFENAAVLNDLVSRDDRIGGKQGRNWLLAYPCSKWRVHYAMAIWAVWARNSVENVTAVC